MNNPDLLRQSRVCKICGVPYALVHRSASSDWLIPLLYRTVSGVVGKQYGTIAAMVFGMLLTTMIPFWMAAVFVIGVPYISFWWYGFRLVFARTSNGGRKLRIIRVGKPVASLCAGILIKSKKITSGIFSNATILITHYSRTGARGFIINRLIFNPN
jgi:hypothetical protein